MNIKNFLRFVLCLYPLAVAAETDAESALDSGAWIPLPVFGNAPETGFELGGYVMRILPKTTKQKSQDRYEVLVSSTSKGLFQGYIWPSINFNEKLKLNGGLGARYWPGKFYGIGNDFESNALTEAYESTVIDSDAWVHYQFLSSFWLTVGTVVVQESLKDDGSLSFLNSTTSGYQGGHYYGVGAGIVYDTRDNGDYPTQGQQHSLTITQFSKALGSDFDYRISEYKAGYYQSLSEGLVLGIGNTLILSQGDVPFRRLPAPDGRKILRGANSAKYIDRNLIGGQLDLRGILSQSWGVGMFIDTAMVSPRPSFDLHELHYAVGIGGRLNTLNESRMNIRFDLALVDLKDLGLVITFGEVF